MTFLNNSTESNAGRRRRASALGRRCALLAAAGLLLAGCDMLDMYDQPKYRTFEACDFFADGSSARPVVPGTIARGQLREDEAFFTGRRDGQFVDALPPDNDLELNEDFLQRGHQRFDIFCSNCHGQAGYGDGMIVQRGFRRPPSFHIDRLRNMPLGYFFDVMTNGFGAMPTYNLQADPRDRWAIAAYVRALQLSQNARLDDVPADKRQLLEEQP
jgi:mono/diheme cytochrome c family protein